MFNLLHWATNYFTNAGAIAAESTVYIFISIVAVKMINFNFKKGVLYTSLQKKTSINFKVFQYSKQFYFKSYISYFTLTVKKIFKVVNNTINNILHFNSKVLSLQKYSCKVNYNFKYKLLKYYSNIVIRDYDVKNRLNYAKDMSIFAKKYNLLPILAIDKKSSKWHKNVKNLRYFYCSSGSLKHIDIADKKRIVMSSAHNTKDVVNVKRFLRCFSGKVEKGFSLAISPVFYTTTHSKAKPIGYLRFYKLAKNAKQILGQGVNIYALGGVNLKNVSKINKFSARSYDCFSQNGKRAINIASISVDI